MLQRNALLSDKMLAQAPRYAAGLTFKSLFLILVGKVWLAAKQGNRKSGSFGLVVKRRYLTFFQQLGEL